MSFAFHLVEKFGVATVPGSGFYSLSTSEAAKVCFPKGIETLQQVAEKLSRLKER